MGSSWSNKTPFTVRNDTQGALTVCVAPEYWSTPDISAAIADRTKTYEDLGVAWLPSGKTAKFFAPTSTHTVQAFLPASGKFVFVGQAPCATGGGTVAFGRLPSQSQ